MQNTKQLNYKHPYKVVVLTLFPLFHFFWSWAQAEYITVDLDPSLDKITEIQQFSNGQGKLLFLFDNKGKRHQYSIVRPDKSILNNLISPKLRDITHVIHDDKEYILFYRYGNSRPFFVYRPEDTLASDYLQKIKNHTRKEVHAIDFFHSGNFYACNYIMRPFTLNTYRYNQNGKFEKQSQVFKDSDKERFWGNIELEDELIFIRYSRKHMAMLLYRFVPGYGFEKKSFDLKAIFDQAGIKAKSITTLSFNPGPEELRPEKNAVNSHIKGNDIYLNMDQLLRAFLSKSSHDRPFPGVVKLNWETGESQLLDIDFQEFENYNNRAVALLDQLYFKLLVNKNQLDLSIFDLEQEQLLKQHTYSSEKVAQLIYERANLEKRHTFYIDFIPISFRTNKIVDGKKLLKNLTRGYLFLDVFSDDDFIELDITSMEDSEPFKTTNFSTYLSISDLRVVHNFDKREDPRFQQIDSFLEQLKDKKCLGEFVIYPFQTDIHLAYIDTKLKQCKVMAF